MLGLEESSTKLKDATLVRKGKTLLKSNPNVTGSGMTSSCGKGLVTKRAIDPGKHKLVLLNPFSIRGVGFGRNFAGIVRQERRGAGGRTINESHQLMTAKNKKQLSQPKRIVGRVC